MTGSRKRPTLAAGVATVGLVLLAVSPAWADPSGRIQEVTSAPGVVSFVLAAEGLSEGQTIDPASVRTTIAGTEAVTEAKPITQEAAAPIGRTAMLLMDSSGSMADFDKLAIAQQSAKQYVDSLPADVQLGLIAFADKAEVKVDPTTDRAAVLGAIDALEANGSTALNDAVVLATKTLGDSGSRNALLLSDGKDEGSDASGKQARSALADSGVVLDAVSLGRGDQEKQLAAFAKAGNGAVVTATNSAELTAAFESAARTVATQLSVSATVPEGVAAGTAEVAVAALAGGQPISDQTAAIIQVAAAPSASAVAGPVPVEATSGGLFDRGWVKILAIVLLFAGILGIAAFAIGAIDASNRKQGRVARRLQEVSVDGSLPQAPIQEATSALGSSAATRGLVSFADRVAQGRDTTAISRKLEGAYVPLRPAEWVVVHALIALAVALVATLLSDFNWIITVIALLLGLLLPWSYLTIRGDRRRRAFYDAIPDSMQMLAGSLAAGYSLPQGLELLAKDVEGPLGQEINRALLESRLGLPLTETLEAVAQRMDSQDFHWVVLSIRTHAHVGGNLAEVLTNVAHTLRERERLRRQVRSLTAEGRISTWIVAILPIFLIVFFAMFRREYLDVLITRPIGWAILAVGAVFYVIGILWVRRLVNMEV